MGLQCQTIETPGILRILPALWNAEPIPLGRLLVYPVKSLLRLFNRGGFINFRITDNAFQSLWRPWFSFFGYSYKFVGLYELKFYIRPQYHLTELRGRQYSSQYHLPASSRSFYGELRDRQDLLDLLLPLFRASGP